MAKMGWLVLGERAAATTVEPKATMMPMKAPPAGGVPAGPGLGAFDRAVGQRLARFACRASSRRRGVACQLKSREIPPGEKQALSRYKVTSRIFLVSDVRMDEA